MQYEAKVYEQRFKYLSDYAKEDWVGLSVIVASANKILGRKATNSEIVNTMLKLINDLMKEGALPGELIEGEHFEPWRGSKVEILQRLRLEIENLNRLPITGEIAWISNYTESSE